MQGMLGKGENIGALHPRLATRVFSVRLCVPAGVLIQIECKAWAKNIRFDRKERVGSVHFELMID